MQHRTREADEFYDRITPLNFDGIEAGYRQALAGMLWTKQFYLYDVDTWLKEQTRTP